MKWVGHRSLIPIVASLLLLWGAAPAEARKSTNLDDLKNQRHLVEFGMFLGAFVPSGDHNLYQRSALGTPDFSKAAFDFGVRLAYLPIPYVGLELEAAWIPGTTENEEHNFLYNIRGHVIGQLPVAKRFAPFLVAGAGLLGVDSSNEAIGAAAGASWYYGIGFKWYATQSLALRIDARHVMSPGRKESVAHHVELIAGFSWVFGWEKDADGDGVVDSRDRCPKKAAATPTGCPAAKDGDGDGVPDKRDECPERPAKTANGCPAPDSDGDGVPDARDRCPDKKASTTDGCPVADGDGDGVPDAQDKCPKVAAKTADGCPPPVGDSDGDGVKDDVDKCPKRPAKTADGCPVADRDKDGIPDAKDKCPNKPETRNGFRDNDGCPDKLPKKLKRFTGTIRGINFATGKAKIRRRSFRVIKKVARMLKKYKAIRLEISGHTDNRGKRAKNVELSRRRAQAVKDYLVTRGIDGARLTVKGVGPDKPIASNKRRRGRAKNRRIEFKILY